MIPMRIVETEREGFDQPVVELWRDDEFVGMVFWDEDTAVVQIYADDDGDVKDLELFELVRVLEFAEQIVVPEEARGDEPGAAGLGSSVAERIARSRAQGAGGPPPEGWEGEDPAILDLVGEFDPQARYRTEDGEGFFPREAAAAFIRRCEELDIAVVEMEGFDWDGSELKERPNLNLLIRSEAPGDWGVFRSQSNFEALDTLSRWPSRDSLVVAFVVQRPDGETYVA